MAGASAKDRRLSAFPTIRTAVQKGTVVDVHETSSSMDLRCPRVVRLYPEQPTELCSAEIRRFVPQAAVSRCKKGVCKETLELTRWPHRRAGEALIICRDSSALAVLKLITNSYGHAKMPMDPELAELVPRRLPWP